MASIDPTGLDLSDFYAVRKRMAPLLEKVRLTACGIEEAEDALCAAHDKLGARDPDLLQEVLRFDIELLVSRYLGYNHAVSEPIRRARWRELFTHLRKWLDQECDLKVPDAPAAPLVLTSHEEEE